MRRIPIGTRSRSTRRDSRAKRRTSRIPSPADSSGKTTYRGSVTPVRPFSLMKAAAASTWKVPVDQVETHKGVATHKASGKTANYGDLVKTARDLPVPKES